MVMFAHLFAATAPVNVHKMGKKDSFSAMGSTDLSTHPNRTAGDH